MLVTIKLAYDPEKLAFHTLSIPQKKTEVAPLINESIGYRLIRASKQFLNEKVHLKANTGS